MLMLVGTAQISSAAAQDDDLEKCILDAASLFDTYKECVSQVISYHAAKVTKPAVIISFAKRQCGVERQNYLKRLTGCMGRDVAQAMFEAEEEGSLEPHLLRLIENAGRQKIHGDKSAPDASDPFQAPMSFQLKDAGRVIEATGVVSEETPEAFEKLIEKAGLRAAQATVRLNSPGGYIAPALKLGRMIRKLGFSTEVGKSADSRPECMSACVFVFLGGVRRAAEVGHLGVHRFYEQLAIDDPDRKAYDSGDLAEVQRLTGELVAYVSEMGADARLVARAANVAADEISHLTGEELRDWRIVLVTLVLTWPNVVPTSFG
ncbi:MAG: hypothetical protein AAF441_05890, partial [Pseudomonadota bacterium]